MKTLEDHAWEVEKIAKKIQEYSKSNLKKKLRFYHGGTNSTRTQQSGDYFFIDISGLNEVIDVNEREFYALVEPNVPMDKLVKTTLEYGLIPPVVMEFPGITVGGAINGATLESSSYKYGQLCDNCDEYEIILSNGKIIKASRDQHGDIFYGISGAYGSLGLLSLIKVRLISATPYIHATFYPTNTYTDTLKTLKEHMDRDDIDYIEGIIFDPAHGVVITGQRVHKSELPIKTYSKATDQWFYEQGKKIAYQRNIYEEVIPIVNYEFRYNRGAFWMAEYTFPLFHIPNNKITRFLLNPFINTRKLYDGFHALNVSQDYFIQDFYCPWDKSLEFLKHSEEKLGIFPIWLCPMKPAHILQKLSPDYIRTDMLLDIGIWGQTEKYLKNPIGINKEFEQFAKEVNARKMLYAHAYYTEEEFWSIYDKKWYDDLRKKYYSDKIFPDVWKKTHVSGEYTPHRLKGTLKFLFDTIKGKHINT